ncbi:MAG: sulfotransferase domain-containing protein [Owenweeksia sp.]|nr:sulfotransferase domain-containing protein [Owenweeksia sp.]
MLHPDAPQRVNKYSPQMKLIAILRNPVERAVSHYRMSTANGMEPLSFKEALIAEEERLKKPLNEGDSDSAWLWNSYKTRGLYAEQIDRWARFFPADQILLINYHHFFKDPWQNIQPVYRFLGVAPYFWLR